MPGGVPVATVALNAAKNAGLLAVQILSVADKQLSEKMVKYKDEMKKMVLNKDEELNRSHSQKLNERS